jgi:hypothetical protein
MIIDHNRDELIIDHNRDELIIDHNKDELIIDHSFFFSEFIFSISSLSSSIHLLNLDYVFISLNLTLLNSIFHNLFFHQDSTNSVYYLGCLTLCFLLNYTPNITNSMPQLEASSYSQLSSFTIFSAFIICILIQVWQSTVLPQLITVLK